MKHIVIVGIAVAIMFFLIAFNLSDYHTLNTGLKESRIAESLEQAEKEREAQNTEANLWDIVHGVQEKTQTTVPEETSAAYSEITDENGAVIGYQQIDNITYDENGNIASFDTVDGAVLSPEEYNEMAANNAPEETTTKRNIPDVYHKTETEFRIVIK